MGAAPGHTTSALLRAPAFLIPQLTLQQKPGETEASAKPFQVGKASWYGGLFQGKATASGEDYNMYDFTAAHRELPLGTFVKVTNLKNLKSVVVRINDRGPVTPGRIIDLSYSAARSLGCIRTVCKRFALTLWITGSGDGDGDSARPALVPFFRFEIAPRISVGLCFLPCFPSDQPIRYPVDMQRAETI